MLKTILLLFSLILGLILIAVGVYIIVKRKILKYSAPLWVGITLTSIGGLTILFLLSITIYDLAKSLINVNFEILRITKYIPELEMFIYMIYSSYYEDNDYKGGNYRGKGSTYYDIFHVEHENRGNIGPYIENDNDTKFNDERLIYVWSLYKEYMKNRFNFPKVIKKIKQYNKMLSLKKNKDYIIIIYVVESYIAIFKLLRRNLISEKHGLEILKHLRETLYLSSKYVPRNDKLGTVKKLEKSLRKELDRENYHPVQVLDRKGIILHRKHINLYSLIPDIEKLKQ